MTTDTTHTTHTTHTTVSADARPAAAAGGPGAGDDREDVPGSRWTAHPMLARILRWAIRLAPVTLAALVSWQLGRVLPAATGLHHLLVIAVVVVVSLAAGLATERLGRRLLPLTALLALTMLFPDRAPSRWKIARRAGDRSATAGQDDGGDMGRQALALLAELTSHDRRTRGHAERVRVFAEMLGAELHLSRDEQDRLRWAALLHDVGKIEVTSSLLNKPGKPTRSEWADLQAHPAAGARLAGPLVAWLGEWGTGIAEHHEKVDGSGYPAGLTGSEISRAGRILAVVDAYEVMTAARSYKKPMNVGKARIELATCAGSHFDPMIVRAFLGISLPRLLWTTGPLSFLANLPFLAGLQAATRAIPAISVPATAAGVLTAGAVVGAVPSFASAAVSAPASAPRTVHATAAGLPDLAPINSTTASPHHPVASAPHAAPVVVRPTVRATVKPAAVPPVKAVAPVVAVHQPAPVRSTPGTLGPAQPTRTSPGSTNGSGKSSSGGTAATTPVKVAPVPVTPPAAGGKPTAQSGYTITFSTAPPKQTMFTVAEFSFSSPSATRYAYRLDGGKWHYVNVTPGRTVVAWDYDTGYGNHTFQVVAVNATGAQLGPVASYAWQTT